MKTLLYTLLAMLALASCSKEEEVVTPPAPNKYTLTITADTGGSVSSPGGTYNEGSKITVTATPDGEYLFDSWSDGSTENPREITVTSNLNLTANFVKKKYSLTVSIEGEGTVTEEVLVQGSVSDYNSGTKVRLKATATGEWSYFAGWTGDLESEENEIIIDINQPMSLTVSFPDTNILVNKNTTEISSSVTSYDIQRAFYTVSGVFPYKAGDNYYTFFPGAAEWIAGQSDNQTKDDIPAMPSQILKRIDGKWEFFKTDYDAYFWGARNYKIVGNTVVIGDGNEIGPDGPASEDTEPSNRNWSGDAYLGDIQDDGNILWQKVNSEADRIYFHGITMGDLNGDGKIDVGGAPNTSSSGRNLKLFIQNDQREFTVQDNLLRLVDGPQPFTLDFHDLDGDSIDEIITADYGGGDPSTDPSLNNLRVYKYNQDTSVFEIDFNSNTPTAFYSIGMGATSIQAADINNDGRTDIIVAREDQAGNAFEVWKGNSSGGFDPAFSSPIWNEDELQFREFWLLDVNQDSYLDIVLRPFHYGALYRNNPVWWDVKSSNGIMLNHIIQINDGNGNFSSYDTEELKIEGLNVDNVNPYLDEGILHFIGTYTPDNSVPYLETVDLKVRIE